MVDRQISPDHTDAGPSRIIIPTIVQHQGSRIDRRAGNVGILSRQGQDAVAGFEDAPGVRHHGIDRQVTAGIRSPYHVEGINAAIEIKECCTAIINLIPGATGGPESVRPIYKVGRGIQQGAVPVRAKQEGLLVEVIPVATDLCGSTVPDVHRATRVGIDSARGVKLQGSRFHRCLSRVGVST